MMVTDNKIDAERSCVVDQINRFDATIQRNYKSKTIRMRIIYAHSGYAIAFTIPVGYVKIYHVRLKVQAKKMVEASYRCCSVDVIISKDKDLLPPPGPHDPVDGLIHVFHKEGIMECAQAGTEKIPCGFKCLYPALHQDPAQYLVDAQGSLQ